MMAPSANGSVNLETIDSKLKSELKEFVDSIFTDSQSISPERKAEFGRLVRQPEARLLFAMYVDDYRVNSKNVSELTFYSLAQYFSIVLLECLLAEDFQPAKVIMNMMFTYYYEQNLDKLPVRDKPVNSSGRNNHNVMMSTRTKTTKAKTRGQQEEEEEDGEPKTVKTYLYTLLKDQEIFKSIRFWTSAFYESVVVERNNHPVFVDRGKGKLDNERRNEESDCSKNITFGLLGSFIHNMSLLDLGHEFCQQFLDKHSTIADLTDEQHKLLKEVLMKSHVSPSSRSSASSSSSLLSSSSVVATMVGRQKRPR